MSNIITAGVDVGSLGTKTVLFADGKIIGSSIIPTGLDSTENGLIGLEKALQSVGLERKDLKFVVATGYGRILAPYADKTVTEITCHAKEHTSFIRKQELLSIWAVRIAKQFDSMRMETSPISR